jgi:alcohol dehydrogenase
VGVIGQLGETALKTGSKRILLVTDAGIVAAGHAGRAKQLLEQSGLSVSLFDRAKENPSTLCVEDCVSAAREAGADGLIAIGGGSSMDTAKGCNFILSNGGRMQDYWGTGKAAKPMLPFIAVPTTAGTGSEMQSAALITDEVTHQKMACLDPKCAAFAAILDPELTLSQPSRVTACTGIDAIAHAVESAVTAKRNVLSSQLSLAAFELCFNALPVVLDSAANIHARARMQLGATYAGAAIENSMLGAAHSAANPLTARFGVIHGHAVGLMLPHVLRWNAADASTREIYESLARLGGCNNTSNPVGELATRLEHLLNFARLPSRLRDCGVKESAIPGLATEAARQWTASFNPRPVSAAEFEVLYHQAW